MYSPFPFCTRKFRPAKHPRVRNRGGEQIAVVRALTGAMLHLGIPIVPPTLAGAATMSGSSIGYIQAAMLVLQAEDEALVNRVRRGQVPLLTAARQVKRRVKLINALRKASAEDRVAALKHVADAQEILNIAVAAEAAE